MAVYAKQEDIYIALKKPKTSFSSDFRRVNMVVLGIDPGSRVTGYSLVTKKSGRFHLLEAGVIKTNTKNSIPERLLEIHTGKSTSIWTGPLFVCT